MRPFRGSEALAAGTLTRGQLRWHHTQLLPDVYVHKDATLTDDVWAEATSVWTRGEGIVAGRTAARLLGAYRVPDGGPVEVISSRRRPPPGVVLRAEHIAEDEIRHWSRYKLTTAARTALDLGRHLPRNDAGSSWMPWPALEISPTPLSTLWPTVTAAPGESWPPEPQPG